MNTITTAKTNIDRYLNIKETLPTEPIEKRQQGADTAQRGQGIYEKLDGVMKDRAANEDGAAARAPQKTTSAPER